jgi:5'-nucleotidase
VAIDAAGAIRTGLFKGKTGVLAFDDVFRVLPLGIGPDQHPGYPLVSFYLNGSDLRSGMELPAAAEVVGADYALQVSGLTMTYDPTGVPFNRVTSISVGGTRIDLTDTTTCYHVTTTRYVAGLLGVVSQVSGGTRSVVPKLSDCTTVITDLNSTIVHTGTGPTAPELKAWQAFVGFLSNLPPQSGVPTIPAIYMTPQGRIVAQAPDAGTD